MDAYSLDLRKKIVEAKERGVPASGSARAAMRATNRAVWVLRKVLAPTSSTLPLAFKMRRLVQSRVLTDPPPLDPELREELVEGYKEDILRLQELIGRDLSAWLEGAGVNGGGR